MGIMARLTRRTERGPLLPQRPWYDEPSALDEIDTRSGGRSDDRLVLDSWVRNGYAIVEGVIPAAAIDAMLEELDGLFTATSPTPGLEFCDLEFGADGHRETIDHAALLERTPEQRHAARDRSSWRVHAFVDRSPAADAVRSAPELRRVASMILGRETEASYSINFHNGSVQALHQDCAVFHLGVPNWIVGAWIACEDITEGSGPLVFYPGSHRDAMYAEFDDYPNTNLRTASDDVAARYNRAVASRADDFTEERFLARKGDVLFWNGMLIHGGSAITDPGTTRKSLVVHFVPDGADAVKRVTLPARW
ncbi:MAG: phytanoyl-CoA dioxygenase family protein [Ilumatobacter sp.]|nr:phytanoyl-CoA dioxygenase family protein [Ilumatobacter sp.]